MLVVQAGLVTHCVLPHLTLFKHTQAEDFMLHSTTIPLLKSGHLLRAKTALVPVISQKKYVISESLLGDT
jgi:hypothetical protein